jgi:uncharacterized protein with GYD domain
MPAYITLYKFTDQGIRNIKGSPERLKTALKAAEAMGVRVLGAYYTVGEYDLVVIGEGENEEAGLAHTLATCAAGNVTSTTLRAFTPEQFAEILKKIP